MMAQDGQEAKHMRREKMAPELHAMRSDRARMRRQSFARRYSHHGIVAEPASQPVRVIVVLECEPDADFSHLMARGIQVNEARGRLRTAFLPLRKLGRLAAEPAVHHIYPSETLEPALDRAAEHVGLPVFRRAAGLTGRGVIIGIVDTGFDPRHPALHGRILRAWDQLPLHGPGVPEGRFGIELKSQQEIETQLCDPSGHGTHVAGIAAGADLKYPGVAPEAELVLVRSDLNDSHVINGLQYIFRVAAELSRPAVVNLSIDSAPGPWDDGDPLCAKINELVGPGRIVCCAAGNRGRQNIHAQVTLVPDQEKAVPFMLSTGLQEVDVWVAHHRSQRVAVAVRFGDAPGSAFVVSDSFGEKMLLPDVTILFSEPMIGSERRRFRIRLANHAARKPGQWHLVLRGDGITEGHVDIWLGGRKTDGSKTTEADFSFAVPAKSGTKIAKAGAATHAITVASYVTRRRWKDIANNIQEQPLLLHDVSPSSSTGPLVGGARKPDFAAPGAWIISALAAQAPSKSETQIDQVYAVREGTSMAAAFMSGAAALLLERDPSLDPQRMKTLLRAVSSIPGQPADAFDPRWGYGYPDMSRL